MSRFKTRLPDWLGEHAAAAVHAIEETVQFDEAARAALLDALRDLCAAAAPADPPGRIAGGEP